MAVEVLDTLGLKCPQPILKIAVRAPDMQPGDILEVLGDCPTFEKDVEPSIETFIFDFDGDLYGKVLRVRFLHRIRAERKFSGIEELKSQIDRDVASAKRYFSFPGVRNMLMLA